MPLESYCSMPSWRSSVILDTKLIMYRTTSSHYTFGPNAKLNAWPLTSYYFQRCNLFLHFLRCIKSADLWADTRGEEQRAEAGGESRSPTFFWVYGLEVGIMACPHWQSVVWQVPTSAAVLFKYTFFFFIFLLGLESTVGLNSGNQLRSSRYCCSTVDKRFGFRAFSKNGKL